MSITDSTWYRTNPTGIFGMNVGGLPWLNDPAGFWSVGGVMIAAITITLRLLRRLRKF